MFVNSMVLVVLGLGLGVQAQGIPYTPCSKAPEVPVNFTILQAYSPWFVYRSSDPTYNCTTGMLTGPAPTDGNAYTWVFLQNNTVKNVAALTTNPQNNTIDFTTCAQGTNYQYHFLTLTTDYWIVYICEPAGQNFWALRGYGHNADDAAQVDSILAKYNFSFTNNATVQNMQTGCADAPYCTDFNM